MRLRAVGVAVVKLVASALTIGSGGSAGREGPIVHIGSAFGSSVASAVYEHGGWLWIVIVGSAFPVLALLRFLSVSEKRSLAAA